MLRIKIRRKGKGLAKALPDDLLDKVLEKAAILAQAKAKRYAPRDGGVLGGSITAFQRGPGVHGISTDIKYAAFQEFGTGRAGAKTDPGPTPGHYVHGQKEGIPSRAFMRPAVMEVKQDLARLTKETIRENL